jgi:hypothetical protein
MVHTMKKIGYTSLDVAGHADVPLPNRFLKQISIPDTLAVILPGLNYSCDNPLLYYTTSLLIDHSADVLQLWANYTVPEFQSLPKPAQIQWLLADAASLIAAGQKNRQYEHLILVGKSIGTLTLGALFDQVNELADASAIWFTPLFHYPSVVEGALHARGRALFVAGAADPTYDADAVKRIELRSIAHVVVIQEADHSLEIQGDTRRSLDVIKEIMAVTETFLDQTILTL